MRGPGIDSMKQRCKCNLHSLEANKWVCFYSNGWTDGLPVVPPTEPAVEACLEWALMPPDQLIKPASLRNVRADDTQATLQFKRSSPCNGLGPAFRRTMASPRM